VRTVDETLTEQCQIPRKSKKLRSVLTRAMFLLIFAGNLACSVEGFRLQSRTGNKSCSTEPITSTRNYAFWKIFRDLYYLFCMTDLMYSNECNQCKN